MAERHKIQGKLTILTKNSIGVNSPDLKFQFLPETINETKTANWNPIEIIARSSPIQVYSSSAAKQITLNLEFLVQPEQGINRPTKLDIRDTINQLRALVYPRKGGTMETFSLYCPPVVVLRCGNWWSMRCIVRNVSIDHNMPWDIQYLYFS